MLGVLVRRIPNKDIAEIHKLRKTAMTSLSIAQRFGISESAVSRICAGHRRAKEIDPATFLLSKLN